MIRFLTLVGLLSTTSLSAQTTGQTWDWQLTEPFDLGKQVAIMDLDPDSFLAQDISRLKARGVFTICYVSVGTVESWRRDASAFPRQVVGRAYEEWAGEKFLDIRQLDILLPLMRARFERCKALGFDAIEPDNMDVHINDSGFPIRSRHVVTYVRALAQLAHDMDMLIGQKNVPDLTNSLEPEMDFVITEGCYADRWCNDVAPYAASGKAILAAEYDIRRHDRPAACAAAQAAGISMIFKSYDLDSSGQSCP